TCRISRFNVLMCACAGTEGALRMRVRGAIVFFASCAVACAQLPPPAAMLGVPPTSEPARKPALARHWKALTISGAVVTLAGLGVMVSGLVSLQLQDAAN